MSSIVPRPPKTLGSSALRCASSAARPVGIEAPAGAAVVAAVDVGAAPVPDGRTKSPPPTYVGAGGGSFASISRTRSAAFLRRSASTVGVALTAWRSTFFAALSGACSTLANIVSAQAPSTSFTEGSSRTVEDSGISWIFR
ncbi:MAG: hypothetical protein ABIV93_21085 [Byssovorax sp.]